MALLRELGPATDLLPGLPTRAVRPRALSFQAISEIMAQLEKDPVEPPEGPPEEPALPPPNEIEIPTDGPIGDGYEVILDVPPSRRDDFDGPAMQPYRVGMHSGAPVLMNGFDQPLLVLTLHEDFRPWAGWRMWSAAEDRRFPLKSRAALHVVCCPGKSELWVPVAIGVHLALVLMLVFIAVFTIQAVKSSREPEKFDRLVLFMIMGVGSAVALAKAISMKPKKEKKYHFGASLITRESLDGAARHSSMAARLWYPRGLFFRHFAAEAAARSSPQSAAAARKVDKLPIPEILKQNLRGLGVTKLFEIQSRAFDPILRGRSFVGRSKTGTGKTVAYLLPLLERMRHEKMTLPHSLLILVPTRELCKQVGSALLSLSVQVDVALVYGGETLHSQEQLVRLGAVAVVATPGRCARLVERGALQTENVRALVIDEADAMFGPEFVGRVERVLNAVAKPGLQHVLFSASLPDDISTLIRQHFPDHELVDLVDRRGPKGEAVVTAVDHRLCKVPDKRPTARARVLMHLLNEKLDMLGGCCIVFVDTASQATALLAHPAMERRARSLHGNSAAEERDTVLTSFANKEFDVLVATDVIARGVDFADVNLVMQLHPPKDAAQYVHRSGRTGRAGRGGTCITLYDSGERRYVQRVRQVTQHEFSMIAAPGPLDVHHAAVSRLLEQLFGVQPEEYEPLLEDAETLLDENGPAILASAMAVLDSRHADLQQALRDRPSIFSGRRGFVCLLANDPEHLVATTEGEVQRIVGSMMPKLAKVGRVARVEGGWAVDVEHRHASGLIEALRSGSVQAPFEVSVARRMPRVLRGRAGRLTKAPWAAQRRWAIKSGVRRREKLAKMTKAHATADNTSLPHYSRQEYWEQRYRNQLGAPEWYLGWPELKRHLCDPDGILGPLALAPPALVLELGCGNFSLVPGLASSGFAALGTDFSPAATAEAAAAARSGAPDFATLDARVLPLRSGIFDAVLDKGCFDALKAHDSHEMLLEACRVLAAGGRFLCVSNNGTLLRSHARKVPGWRCALGSPFCIPDLDDELYLHCYVRDAESRLHSTLTSNLGYPVLPAPDSGPRGCAGPSQHKPTLHKLVVSVPWACRASDIALHVADGEELQVVVAPNGVDCAQLAPTPWQPGPEPTVAPQAGLRLCLPRYLQIERTAKGTDGSLQQEPAPRGSFSAKSKILTFRLHPVGTA
ncbi:unnamed protein product [Symbiodinium microadriaticum]|nr:unnamed protein product [Symbiodinium microadriaticum]